VTAFNFRRRHTRRWWYAGATMLAAALFATIFIGGAGAAKPQPAQPSGPFAVPTGTLGVAAGFEDNDGNMRADNTVPTGADDTGGGYSVNFDWNKLEPSGLKWGNFNSGNQSGVGNGTAGLSTNGGWQTAGQLAPIGNAAGQNSFAGGTKQDDDCPAVINQGVQNKDDLKGIYLAAKTISGGSLDGHTILEAAWERAPQNTTSASAHVAFEFNQNKHGTDGAADPCGAGSDGLVHRTTGDLLLVFDFTGGSTAPPTISLSRWVDSGACQVGSDSAPCWGTFTNVSALSEAEANVDNGLTHLCKGTGNSAVGCGPNEVDVSTNGAGTNFFLPSSTRDCLAAGSGPTGSTLSGCNSGETSGGYALGTSEFGEYGVDLTAAHVFDAGICSSFGQVEGISRSSGDSSQAAMEKLVGPLNFTLTNCFPVGLSTRQYFYPQDKARITASSGGNLGGTVYFSLYDTSAHCLADGTGSTTGGTFSYTPAATGLLYSTSSAISGASAQTATTSNGTDANNRYVQNTNTTVFWHVFYHSTNPKQLDQDGGCSESTQSTFAGNDATNITSTP
jgi:hypothetical protein